MLDEFDADLRLWYTEAQKEVKSVHIPASIKRRIGNKHGVPEEIGHSDAHVLMFDDMVLKIQPDCNMAANEHHMLRWLQGRLPVPEIIEEAHVDGYRYLLMSRIGGRYLCADAILDDQHLLAELMADGLRKLWAVDISDCPTSRTLKDKFKEIEEGLRGGWITKEQAGQPDTYGPGGFASPAALFDWLVKHRPTEELVLSHGDYCLPNIFATGHAISGYIDVGLAGIADKWVDIDKGLWSMWANTTGLWGGKQRPFDRQLFFDALHMEPDDDKIRYYGLLDELC